MTTPESAELGVLVVHDDGAVSWWSARVPAVAPVAVTVGSGAAVEIDAADPSTVVGWTLRVGGDVAALADAFGDNDFDERIRELTASGRQVFVDQVPTLAEKWVRRATVAAVETCTIQPINTAALQLDRADADHVSGRTEIAAAVFDSMAQVLLDLGEDCLAGDIVGGAVTDVRHLVDVAGRALAGTAWETDLFELGAQLDDDATRDDPLWDDVLAEWHGEALVGAGAFAASDHGRNFWIDPAVVPPRLLAWAGAEAQDVFVTWQPGAERAIVTARLAAAADSRSAEATELIAYAADPKDATVVAIAPMRVEGRAVVATIVCAGQDVTRLHFGIYHGAADIAALRLDGVGRLLVRVDRWMREAFSHHRFALAAVHAEAITADVAATEAKRDQHLASARSAADRAVEAIADYVAREDPAADVSVLLDRRKTAIEAYRRGLDSPGVTPLGAATLLSELLPAEVDED